MKKFFWVFVFILNFAFWSVRYVSATDVSGIISTDTTWTVANSPYIVTGNIMVSSGTTLTIEPGVEVRFDGYYYLHVEETLDAQGTSSDMIVFTSNKTSPAPGDWKMLNLWHSHGSTLSYVRVEYHYYAVNLGADTIMTHSIIEHNRSDGGINVPSGAPTICYNTIRYNGVGINQDGGIVIRGASPTITHNIITQNSVGINSYAGNNGASTISNNNIYNNEYYDFQIQDSSFDIDVANNWWGVTDTTQIDQHIYDYYDDPVNSGKVIYLPFATEPFFAPSKITGLSASPGPDEGEVNLSWSAPGSDGTEGTASCYSIRYSTAEVTENNWDSASVWNDTWPVSGHYGTPENETITGLSAGATYHFRIKTENNMEMWSSLSNEATAWARIIPPSPITNLSARIGETVNEVILEWTAPGDDGTEGNIVNGKYWIKYSSAGEISSENWNSPPQPCYETSWTMDTSPGNIDTKVITGLQTDTTWRFAIKTRDENETGWSLPVVLVTTSGDTIAPEKPVGEKMTFGYPEGTLEGEAGCVEPYCLVEVYVMDPCKYPVVVPVYEVLSAVDGAFPPIKVGSNYRDLWIVSVDLNGNRSASLYVRNPAAIPTETKLLPVRPNPCHFPGHVILGYELKEAVDEVTIKIFTVGGQLVKTLENMPNTAGKYLTGYEGNVWDGTNEDGDEVPADVYCVFMTIKTAAFKEETIGPQFILLDRFPFLNYEEGQTLHRQSEFLSPGLYEVPITSWDITVPPDGVVYLMITRPNLDNVIVYPNPYKPGSGGSHDAPYITFASLTSDADIKIFTVAAELVTEFENKGGDNIETWDATNDSGKKVASGIYIYVVTNDTGQNTIGKFLIIR